MKEKLMFRKNIIIIKEDVIEKIFKTNFQIIKRTKEFKKKTFIPKKIDESKEANAKFYFNMLDKSDYEVGKS
jgi:hypothetical protein